MENHILNEKYYKVFVIIAETLDKWESPNTELGKRVLMSHYAWGSELKKNNKLILAGPTDFELTSTGVIDALGHTTGIIMLNAETREEAEELAFQDPFHTNGFRKNLVYSMDIRMTHSDIYNSLQRILD
jgi:uncharacterized protein YciI